MIDFIKIRLENSLRGSLMEHNDLQFIEHVNRTTGQVYQRYNAAYKNLKFVIYPKSIICSGSLHVLHNLINDKGHQNYNDYDYQKLKETINILAEKFGIDPSRTRIQNLEYGVNVIVPLRPESIIRNNVIAWDGKEVNQDKEFDGKGKYKEWQLDQYYIKLYSKSKQFNLDSNLLRYEKKCIKSAPIVKCGVKYLSDLLDKSKLEALRDNLVKSYQSLVIIDSVMLEGDYSPKELDIFTKGINPNTWYYFEKGKQAKYRFKKSFSALLKKSNLDTLKMEIHKSIVDKWNSLMCYQFTDYTPSHSNYENVTNSHVYIVSNGNTHYPTKPNTLESKKKECSVYKLHSDHPDRKKTRNNKSNPRNNLRRRILRTVKTYSGCQGTLFPLASEMQLTKDQYDLLRIWKGTKYDILTELERRGVRLKVS